jgi:hypothetical protein
MPVELFFRFVADAAADVGYFEILFDLSAFAPAA